jgi:3-oxoacyl-[acyl-carrier-protein] synthase-3
VPPELLAQPEPLAAPATATEGSHIEDHHRGPTVARIASVAMAVPETVVGNAEIAARLGVEPGWISKRTGIHERREAGPEERLSDIAARAGAAALERAGIEGSELDLVLVGTTTQDELTPNTAPLVAHALGASRAAAMDVGAACVAFVSALSLAAGQIEAGRARTALVIGADVLRRWLDLDDRRTAAVFGDGGGAVVLTAGDGPGGVGSFVLHSDGSLASAIYATREESTIRMDGVETFKNAVRRMAEVTREALDQAGLETDDVDLFVYHQANARILTAVAEELSLPLERVVEEIADYGNTSAGTIPIALTRAAEDGRLRDGSRVLLGAFGAGFVWGAGVVEWGAPDGR